MTTLITGGAGFLGSHICRELVSKGESVVVFDNLNSEQLRISQKLRMPDLMDKVKFVTGDITAFPSIFQSVKENNVDRIIHTAAITFVPAAIKNPSLTFKVNIEGSFNILEAARILDLKKVLYISTSSVYGDFQKPVADETHPLEPKEIYGASKLAADRLAISYNKTYGIDVSVVRTTSIYGPGDLENRAAKIFIENALQGKEITLEGGGLQKRDFSFVKDVAHGVCLAAMHENSAGEVFHIAGGAEGTVRNMAERISKYIPGTKIVETPARKIDTNRGRLDISKAKRILGFEPKFSLDDGVRNYINWMANYYFPFFEMKIINKPVGV